MKVSGFWGGAMAELLLLLCEYMVALMNQVDKTLLVANQGSFDEAVGS